MKFMRLLMFGMVMLMANGAGAQNSVKRFDLDEATISAVHVPLRPLLRDMTYRVQCGKSRTISANIGRLPVDVLGENQGKNVQTKRVYTSIHRGFLIYRSRRSYGSEEA
jgi:hypothetical protein